MPRERPLDADSYARHRKFAPRMAHPLRLKLHRPSLDLLAASQDLRPHPQRVPLWPKSKNPKRQRSSDGLSFAFVLRRRLSSPQPQWDHKIGASSLRNRCEAYQTSLPAHAPELPDPDRRRTLPLLRGRRSRSRSPMLKWSSHPPTNRSSLSFRKTRMSLRHPASTSLLPFLGSVPRRRL